jgi:hypothetical protein
VIFFDRRRKGDDPFLEWKVRLFLAGAAVALVGMARNSSWLVLGGILILLAGASLRFFRRPGAEAPGEGAGEDEGDEARLD